LGKKKRRKSKMISREQALELVKEYNKEQSDINHYLETEVIMKALAKRLGEDEEYWGMLGLLHDLDWGITKDDVKNHTLKTAEILKEVGFDNEFIEIIKSHCYGFEPVPSLVNKKRTRKVEHALICAETITGLIYAYALLRGGMEGMKPKGLMKRFKEKRFAANVDREIVKECEHLGLELSEFFEIAINAMKGIASEIGL